MAGETCFSQLHTVHMATRTCKILGERGKLDGRAGLWMLKNCRDGSDLLQQTLTRALRRDTALWREAQGLYRSRTPGFSHESPQVCRARGPLLS